MTLTLVIAAATLAPGISLVPMPQHLELRDGQFLLRRDTAIVAGRAEQGVAKYLQSALQPATGYPLAIRKEGERGIRLVMDRDLHRLGDEGYRLRVNALGVEISAPREAGLFYGVQTLRQLLPTAIFSKQKADEAWLIPHVEIEDSPRFMWRGAHMDVSRHFMPKEFVLKFLDLMALHKLNTFHFHLTEDQGWRVQIEKYPKLTEIGSVRKQTMAGHYSEGRYDGKPHGGYYTQDDLREIVAYARERHITVVPEIEMPGHSVAALAAYPELSCTGGPFEVETKWGVFEDIYCAGREETYTFLEDVLTEVLDIFPSAFIHVGGDEAPKNRWKACPRCQAKIKAEGLKDEHELQSYFIRHFDKWLAARGRRLIGWDEILEGGLAPGATVMSWRGMGGGIAAARAGHDVVMAPNNETYLDHYQSRDTASEPVAIGGFTPISEVYRFEPVPSELSEAESRHVLGAQGQLWSEYIPNPRHMEYMAYPRSCALSEVVWTRPARKDFTRFMQMLPQHLERLTLLDVNFRPLDPPGPPPAGFWKGGEISESFTVREWDVSSSITGSGPISVTFTYTHGSHRLDIQWAELVRDDTVIQRVDQQGTTGGANRNNTYRFDVPNHVVGARYTLRASIRADGGTDSNGEILVVSGG